MMDPICGMNVEPNSAAGSHVHNGQTYYFCSQHCLAKFKEDPERFLKSPATEHAAHGHGQSPADSARAPKKDSAEDAIYVCPMDPEVRESKPGACPKCGMALEPAAPAAPSVKTEYVCPMHPEIVRPEPGACPICGMALEPRTVTLAEEANSELTRHDAAILGWRCFERADFFSRHVRYDSGAARAARFIAAATQLVSARSCHSGGALGRMAVLSARLGVHRQSQSKHVHADRHRSRHCVRLQSGRHAFPRRFSAIVPRPRRRGGRLLRRRGGDHHICFARSGIGAARPQQHRQSDQSVVGACAQERASAARRRHGNGRGSRARSSRRSSARPPGRKDSRRWNRFGGYDISR